MKTLILTLLLASQLSISAQVAEAQGRISTQDEGTIRRIVYGGRARRVGSQIGFSFEIVVPAQLSDLYAKQSGEVLDVLMEIIAGGNPTDSVTAAAYAVSLAEGPVVGEVCISIFDADHYDATDKDWGRTPRQHWIEVTKHLRKR